LLEEDFTFMKQKNAGQGHICVKEEKQALGICRSVEGQTEEKLES
jgi:hypothetical protein